jgi:hypothetical protein
MAPSSPESNSSSSPEPSSSSIALNKPDIVRQILEYVGPGHWLFSLVNTLCVQLYYGVASVEKRAYARDGREYTITCIPQMTLYSSAFASPSRLRLTDKQCTIQWTHDTMQRYQYALGRHADIDTLRAAHKLGLSFSARTLRGAATADAVAKLQWLCTQHHFAPSTELSFDAARGSSLAVLRWLSQQGVVFTTKTAVHAARGNQLAALQHLRNEGCPWGVEVCKEAAASGSFEALRWLRTEGCPWEADKIIQAAASSGSVELTEWVRQQPGVTLNSTAVAAAAAQGHTAVCAFLLQHHHHVLNTTACLSAVKSGHVDTLRFLRQRGCPWDADQVRIGAAVVGSVELLQYLQQEGLLATAAQLTLVLNIAGAHCKLEAVKWLREQGAQWPDKLKYKSKYWRGATLAWARLQGCTAPLGTEYAVSALFSAQQITDWTDPEVVGWLMQGSG